MDHLPIPDHCRQNVPQVPYLGIAPKYDEQGFEGFPERHGLETHRLLEGDFNLPGQNSSVWLESFLQEWLYFGMLHEFSQACSAPLRLGDFIAHKNTRLPTMTTRPLPSYVRAVVQELAASNWTRLCQNTEPSAARDYSMQQSLAWQSFVAQGDITLPALKDARLEKTNTVRATSLLSALHSAPRCVHLARSRDEPVITLPIALSIELLCCSLGHFTQYYLGEIDEKFSTTPYGWELEQSMARQGWCRNRVERSLYDAVDTTFIMSLLPSHDTRSHKWCRPEACSEDKELETMHDTTCQGTCGMVKIDETDLVDIFQKGGNPGIMMQSDESGAMTYQLVNALDYPFIAISHVWSHGLGNPGFNALPDCQMKRLFGFSDKLPTSKTSNSWVTSLLRYIFGPEPRMRSLVLWIDTLSVPINRKHKSLAITKLRELYRKAAKVLVVDRYLLQVGEHWLERRLQLLCFEWSRRLWTLQEGRFASSLYVQFQDQAVDVEDFLQPMGLEACINEEDLLHNMFEGTRVALKSFFDSDVEPGQHFLNLIDDLGYRSTTKSSDESICIATLLGMPLEDFRGAPTMVDVYRSCKTVPEDVIFVKAPRLDVDGYRWAPKTLLNQGIQFFGPSERNGVQTASGFQVVRNGIHFLDTFDYENTAYNFYYLCSSDGTVAWTFFGPVARPDVINVEQPSRRLRCPAIIVQKSEQGFHLTSRGILVSEVENDGPENVFKCKFEMTVSLDRWTESTAAKLGNRTSSIGLADREGWRGPFKLQGRFEEQRTWCIR